MLLLVIELVCLFCLMMLTFMLNRLACCKGRIYGLLGLQLFGRAGIVLTYIGSKENNQAALIYNSFALHLLTDNITPDLVICYKLSKL